jgi:CubicO group peptidase (beta-lactamase class C family)
MNIAKKILFSLIVLCLSITIKAQEINQKSLQGIDSLVEQAMEKYKIPGAVIGLVHSSKLEKITPYGHTDLQNLSKTKDISNFDLASLSKQFTASAIILLQQMGKLSIEDNLSDYFPEIPTHWKGIKIKHLLWHTSG